MSGVFLHNAVLLDPERSAPAPGALLLRDGRIAARLAPDVAAPDAECVDLRGRHLAPGFLDLHHHGALIFADADGFHDALLRDAGRLVRHGTTGFLATSVAWPSPVLGERVARLASLCADAGGPGAAPLGIHLEGPWINPAAAGAQPGDAIEAYDPGTGADALAQGEGLVRMVTLAPEVEGAHALLEALARMGIVAALGHSLCGADAVDDAIDRGAAHVTHLFNAMGRLHHREPGLAGAALADDRLTCDLICDGVHVEPRIVRTAARALAERLVLITDRIDPPRPDGSPGANPVTASFGSGALTDDGRCLRLPDGRLAGSRVTLDVALDNAILFADLTRLEAVAACTVRPARVLGLESERGTLREGARADFAVLEGSRVVETWIAGERVFSA